MENTRFTGLWGEIFAARYLRDLGLTILCANYRTRNGEIDLIAQDDEYIIFIEVKTRGEGAIAQPKESVDYSKQKKLSVTALEFLGNNPYQMSCRFDVIEVFLDENYGLIKINHIKDAFEAAI
ncbi:MAG: YraN family protein [Clostridiales bacterium]|jgi:putative endonuclease|nr:YraN family protein [Clostridiales bacterium]